MAVKSVHLAQGLATTARQRLVLVGGGHAHAQVIKALKRRPEHLDVTLIDVNPSASYSGMVPGCVAKLYTPDQTKLHLKPLCNWANIEFVQDEVVDMNLDTSCISLRRSSETISFDAISLDIGSSARGLDSTPGARGYTIPTRPISKLVERIAEAEKSLGPTSHVVVVGGGPAGIELAMSMRGRWDQLTDLKVTLLDAGSELVPNESAACKDALKSVLAERDIEVVHERKVTEVTTTQVLLDDESSLTYTHCVWAAGAASHSLAEKLQQRGLAVSDRGWIQVSDTFQSLSHPKVFAAGDCCTIEGLEGPSPPKAGVYAVRSGPILVDNLTRFLEQSGPLAQYRPQDDFLKLLACGDGTGLGFRFGIPVQGKWVFEMKDHIDQLFMDLFREEYLVESTDETVSQFDAIDEDPDRVRLHPSAAATLLQRKDDSVQYMKAWLTIRDMAQDKEYCEAVLEKVGQALLSRK